MAQNDTALLGAVQDEVAEIKDHNHTAPDKPVSYQPLAWTRQGTVD